MNKPTKYLLWVTLFALVSCSNISRWCKHIPPVNGNLFSFAKTGITTGNTEDEGNTATTIRGNDFLQAVELQWQTLGDVTYRKKWNAEMKMDFMYPVFGDKVKKLNGKDLYIEGFIIPLNIQDGLYAISYNPYSSCYFCGGAGPESVISLKFKNKPRRYDTDEYLTIRGTMALNDTDVNDFIYIFKNAEEYKK